MTARLSASDTGPAAALAGLCLVIGIVAGIDPRLAVFAALGIGFVLLTFADLAIGVVVLTLVVFAETTPLAGPAISFTKLTGLLLAIAWFARLATQPADQERVLFDDHPILSYLLAALLGWSALSISWAEDSTLALTQASRLLLVAVLFVIVYTAVSGRRRAAWVIGGFVTGTAATAAYGLVLRPSVDTVESGRLVSTIEDPNFLAATLVAGTALALGGFVAARGRPPVRVGALVAATLCLAAFMLTGSRGGIVAFAVALVTMVGVAGRHRGRAALVAGTLAFAAAGYYAAYAPQDVRERISSATQGEAQREEGRFTIWTVGWRMVEDNPIRGVGVGNFEVQSPRYVLEPGTVYRSDRVIDEPGYAHNTYLGVLAELGAVGAGLFITVVGFSVGAALSAARRFAATGDWQMEALARALVVALAGVLAADFFVSAETSKVTWLLLALGPAMLGIARRQPSPSTPETPS